MLSESKDRLEQLIDEAATYGITLSSTQAQLMLCHLDLVLEKNKELNLTRITDPIDAVRLHDVDSALFSLYISPTENFIDIGTGAGFPGIPLAITTGAQGILLDSLHKRVVAVEGFVKKLGLDSQLEVVADRAESFAIERPKSANVVVARAVAQIGILLEYATPLLTDNGRVVISKGVPSEEELSLGDKVAEICGLQSVSRETYDLPEGAGQRTILVYKKCAEPTMKLPRKPGMAIKRPLGA